MWIFLLLSMTLPESLSPTSMPQLARQAGPASYWLVAARPGQKSELYRCDQNRTQLIDLPKGTLFVAPLGSDLLCVFARSCERYRLQGQTLEPTGTALTWARALERQHSWIFMDWEPCAGKRYLAIFDRSQILLIPDQGDKPISIEALDPGADPFLNTRVFGDEKRLYWNDADHLYHIEPTSSSTLTTQNTPTRENMESAVALAQIDGTPIWFVHGGKRGVLESFGWRLSGKNCNFTGKGIVTRFGADRGSKSTKLVSFTIPNSISSQIWRALSSSRDFSCTQTVYGNGTWRRAPSFDVDLTKPENRVAPYDLSWETDLNHDGYGDLIAVDARGLRVYLSEANGFWRTSSLKLEGRPDAVLFLPDRLLLGTRGTQAWTFQARKNP